MPVSPLAPVRARRGVPALTGTLALVLLVAASPELAAQGVLDQVAGDYRDTSLEWIDRLIPVAQRLFMYLAAIEIAVSAVIWGLRRNGLDDVIGQFVLKVAILALCFALIFSFEFWIPPIVDGFRDAGARASGRPGYSPSQIVDLGIDLYTEIVSGARDHSLLLNPILVLTLWIASVIIALSFIAIAVQFVLILVNSYLVLSAGVVFLGFAGWRATAPLADNYITYAIHVGIQLFMVTLLVGIGLDLAETWRGYVTTAGFTSFGPVFQVLGGTLVFAALVTTLPRSFARGITGGVSLGLANAVRSGGGSAA
jgi:type IV secretion system protein TrbL